MLKATYSLAGVLLTTPYVGYHLITFKKGVESVKRTKVINGLIVQVFFSLTNMLWSRQFFKYEEEM